MYIDAAGLDKLMQFEGYREEAYFDGTGYACGFGHHGRDITPRTLCTVSQARQWLIADTNRLSESITKLVTVPLNQGQFNVLVIFAYNIGINAFAPSDLLQRLNCGRYSDIPNQLIRWVHFDGKVDSGLVARRDAEIALWNQATNETQTQTPTPKG